MDFKHVLSVVSDIVEYCTSGLYTRLIICAKGDPRPPSGNTEAWGHSERSGAPYGRLPQSPKSIQRNRPVLPLHKRLAAIARRIAQIGELLEQLRSAPELQDVDSFLLPTSARLV